MLAGYLPLTATAQYHISGTVYGVTEVDGKHVKEPLPMANVYWAETTAGTTTDMKGRFGLEEHPELPAKLVFSFVGYTNDTVLIEKDHIKIDAVLKAKSLKVVEVEGKRSNIFMSTITPIAVEHIGEGELERAACCNLSESFETNASVDVVESDAVSGTRKIRMLGLDGIYTQLQLENVPFIRGHSSSTGLSSIPGTWVQSIQISKGAGSVVNGHEAITGQINVEMQKPEKNNRLYVNLYGNDRARMEGNVQITTKPSEKWGANYFLHGSGNFVKHDRNDDGFLDMPVYRNLSFFNRWKKTGEKHMMQVIYRIVDETTQSGQTHFNEAQDFGTSNAYGIGILHRQYELFLKNGFIMPEKPGKSVGILAKANYHDLDTYFGTKNWRGIQKTGYVNVIHQSYFGTTAHTWKTGASFRYDYFQESYNDSGFVREEIVPGAFFEYTYDDTEKFSIVAGVRGDMHNIYGFKVSPRLHLKYNPEPLTVVRASGGSGFRAPNVFADNMGLMASSREMVVLETPEAEEAWNFGGSIMRKFTMFGEEAFILTEFFHTDFVNQLVVDMDQSARKVVFYNLDGRSYADAWQTEIGIEPIERLGVRVAYKFTEARTTLNNDLQNRPLVPRHRALVSVGYVTANDIWSFDATTTWTGAARLPYTGDNDPEYQLAENSVPFFKQHFQVTKQFRWFDLYVGVENAFNFMQDNPILAANDPFGKHFDASMIWGPVNGRIVYGGLRYKLK